MKTQKLILLLALPIFLSACSPANNSSLSASSEPSTSPSSEPTSSTSSQSLSSGDLQEKLTLDSSSALSFNAGSATFEKDKITFKIVGGEVASNGWFTLKQGGYLTNTTPLSAASFSGITVDFLRMSDFGYLTSKASSYLITSPENGAYEMSGSTALTYSDKTLNSYFSLYATVGSFTLNSVTLTYANSTLEAAPVSALDFYTLNDTHGAVEEIAASSQPGITRLSQYALGTERANPDSSVFLSSGDMWQGSADSNLTHGQIMVNWMNVAGFESMAIGNHEFDWKPEMIAENSALANFPFLGINIRDASGNRPAWAKASKVVNRGGYKIGVIGAIGPIENDISVSSLSSYSFARDYPALIAAEADRLRQEEGCSLVVLSIHNGEFDTSLCHNIDAVFEGHSHQKYQSVDSYGIPHLQAGKNGGYVQHARFVLKEGKFVFQSYDSVDFTVLDALSEEPMALGVYGYYNAKTAAIKNEVVGTTASTLSRADIGKYAAQCLFEYYRSKWSDSLVLGVINTGGVRTEIPAGNITYGEIYACLPFDNDNVLCTCTGDKVQAFIDDSQDYYVYGSQVTIDTTATYQIVTLNYLSEKTEYSYLNETKRDGDNRLRDIVAAAFRSALNG